MPIVRDGKIVEDPWVSVADDQPLPDGEPVIVSLARWQNERATLAHHNLPLGVRLRSSDSAAEIAADLQHFGLIVLEFPKFNDGRAFSAARLLRERYGFKGEIRATGHIIRDQLLFLVRCGVDSLDAKDESWAEKWRIAQAEMTVVYQPGADARRPALALRHPLRAAQ
jgi:uncharacterized protein (DUF934 family)